LALTIVKEQYQMPHPGTMGAPVIRAADITKSMEEYENHSSRTGTNPGAKDAFAIFLYCC